MDILGRINLFVEIYINVLRSLKSPRLLAPFLILALLKAAWLIVLVFFYLTPVYKLLAPLLGHFYSARILHFPQFYLVLPQVYKYGCALFIDLVFGIVLIGAAVFIIGTDYKREKGGLSEGIRTALKSFWPLLAVWILKTGLTILIFKYSPSFVFPLVRDFPYADFSGLFIVHMLALIISALLIYTYPAIIMHRQGLFQAVGNSLRLTAGNFVFTFFLMFIPWLIQFPISYITSSKIYFILGKFSSSVLIYLLALDIAATFIAGFLTYVGVTYFYLNQTE